MKVIAKIISFEKDRGNIRAKVEFYNKDNMDDLLDIQSFYFADNDNAEKALQDLINKSIDNLSSEPEITITKLKDKVVISDKNGTETYPLAGDIKHYIHRFRRRPKRSMITTQKINSIGKFRIDEIISKR